MLSDFIQTKTHKSKTQPAQSHENPSHQSQPYINPVIKHTLQSLPIIYGGNMNRKRKYNVFMKSKLQLNNIISRVHDKNYLPNQRLYKRLNSLNDERQKGYSCMEMNDSKELGDEREEITKTVTKKSRRIDTCPDVVTFNEKLPGHSRAVSNHQKMHQALVTPKNKKLLRLDSVHQLAKPRDRCNKQYCSCKSIYEEYQNEIDKKMKQKLQVLSSNKKDNQKKLNLPRLSCQIGEKALTKLDDQESKHKVSFKTKINSMDEASQNLDNCCHLCKKEKKDDQITEKGILGLIKKKELEQKKRKLQHYSKTQNIGIQMGQNVASQTQPHNEEYGIQANLIDSSKKLKTIDQEINTDFDQQSHSFRHLQNNKSLKQSALKQNKKQPMQHLSHLKQKYKYQKRPSYQSKYGADDEENEKNHQNDEDSDASPGKCKNPDHKKNKNKNKRQSKEDPLNTSNDSIISQNSIMNHLANALASNGKDKSTIFKLLKKKEEEESQRQNQANQTGKGKNKKSAKSKKQYKKMNLIDQETGLFSIPEEQEYVDYLKGYQPIQKDFKIKDIVKSENFKILKYKDTLYFGEATVDNTKNGKALVISPKEIFEGVYENGVKMSGCERNIDGVYMGEFLNGMRHGQGKWIWNNGQIYEGDWKLGTKNGYGTWKSPKGDSYEGEWVLNRQQGKGIHKHKNSVYEGQFIQALKEGHGRQKYINGDEYIGEYYKGRPHGKGKYVWKNGNYYEGQFKDGLRSGYGKWSYSNKAFYEGEFHNDFKHGKGKQIFQNADQYEGDYFEGEKVNGVYIEFATGKVKEIKVDNKRYINQEKSKEKELTQSNIKSKSQENEKSPNQISRKPSKDKIVKNPQKSKDLSSEFKAKSLPVENEQSLKNSKVQIKVEDK